MSKALRYARTQIVGDYSSLDMPGRDIATINAAEKPDRRDSETGRKNKWYQ